jgi:NADH-quinone oxidoreductase subunit L
MTVGAWICLAAPLAGALAITVAGTSISRRAAGYVATLSVLAAFGGAVASFVTTLTRSVHDRSDTATLWTWLSAGNIHFGLTILADPLSVFMMLVVSGVGFLIVAYSIGYMDGEDEERRFFAYMALFVFSMLLLVEAGNFLILLAGWGLVGLCSYLLIGFYHERPSAIAAAKKAFVMNALGDATIALALFILIAKFGTLDFGSTFSRYGTLLHGGWAVNLIALGLLGGAVAKSAQLPLHTWLPDAMEGPTPVSALIHAATMVTAGVFMLVRLHSIFEAAPHVQQLAAGIGAATLVFAGLVALVQTDIKRVIAYSTMSQIGYMFLGAGIGAYANGMFHLMTHAFFKALLFLGAGLVIHVLAGEQDMRRMGGLKALMPRTYLAMLVGGLALAGMPPFSGFFSKDSILASAWADGTYGKVLCGVGLAGVFLTGLYTFRMLFVVFGGEPSPYVREHLHTEHGEGPFSMGAPVAVLTLLATIGGFLQIAGVWKPLADFLSVSAKPLVEPNATQDWLTALVSVSLGVAGIAVAWWLYGARRLAAPRLPYWQRLLEHKFYFDEIYDTLFYRPADELGRAEGVYVERPVIGGTVAEVAAGARDTGGILSHLQTGLLRSYALAIGAGLAVLVVVFISVRG